MGLGILLSLFLLIKFGVLSLSVNISPKSNPFTLDLDYITESKKLETTPKKSIIKLPAPDELSSTKGPGITEGELKLALLHSKKIANELEKYKSKNPRDIDEISISSASTFNYDFEKPDDSVKRNLESPSRSLSNEEKNVDKLLESAINDLDKRRRYTLDEIEKKKKIPPKPPNKNKYDNSEAKDNKSDQLSFLTGINLVDDVITPLENESTAENKEKQEQTLKPNVPPTTKYPIYSGKPEKKVKSLQVPQKNIVKLPHKKVSQEQEKTGKEKKKGRFNIKKILNSDFFKFFKEKKKPESKVTLTISRPIIASSVRQTEDEQSKRTEITEQTNNNTDFEKKINVPLNILEEEEQDLQVSGKVSPIPQTSRTPSPQQSRTPSPKRSRTPSPQQSRTPSPKPNKTPISQKSRTPTPEPNKTPSSQKSRTPTPKPNRTPSPQPDRTSTPESNRMPSSQSNKTLISQKGRTPSPEPNTKETAEETKNIETPTKRAKISQKVLDNDQEQNLDKKIPRPQSSESIVPNRLEISEPETDSSIENSRSSSRIRKIRERLPSMGSDNVFYDSDDYRDEVINSIDFEGSSSSSSEPSIYSAELYSNFESSFTPQNLKDPLEEINIGINKIHEGQRVYEKFVPSRGFDRILQNKLINTYNSDDELVENSIFDKIKNKIKRHRKEAKRKKERSKGIPSRVITEKDVYKFADLRETEFQPEEQIKTLPKVDITKRKIPKSASKSNLADSLPINEPKNEVESKGSDDEKKKVDQSEIRRSIEEFRDIEMDRHELESDSGSLGSYSLETKQEYEYEPIQNPLEALTYNDELKQLKYARDDYFRNKFLQGLSEETKKEESDKLLSQIAEKEALLKELEKISNELDKKRNQFTAKEESPANEESISDDQKLEKQDKSVEANIKDEDGDEGDGEIEAEAEGKVTAEDRDEKDEPIYPEQSLKLDEDAIIMGAEKKENNKGIVVLDPENANYEVYYDDKADQDEDGLAPIKEYNEEGLMPIQQTNKLSESEGLIPVGGFSKLKELQAFEDPDRSLLPVPEESQIPFEEVYLTKHPELLNTDTVGTLNKEKAIKKAFGEKSRKGGILRKREFENFNLSNDAIDRLKRNPFKTPEEKEKIFRILRAKEELNSLREEERKKKQTKQENTEYSESSIEASELYPVESTRSIQKPTINKISDESLLAGDFEEASETSETTGISNPLQIMVGEKINFSDSTDTVASENEMSELAVEVGLARLNAIKATERKQEREKNSDHQHYAPYVRKNVQFNPKKIVETR
ncbi:uncharacterized protein cubi_03757 [Cryptosporidium ubiquitum]|uniref:Uncharacterized protein n=1 Tax=Cryptosporidium ubiquitum TaxID=857276 RepID=A0A1J4MM72_9CRYT|nr:uncharacterized protein cubi_03757 [Cryptosporidium ubiquitum]OII75278.1 hypothetical protein cubi_03757 [Cryptosporidium ubiquitum]